MQQTDSPAPTFEELATVIATEPLENITPEDSQQTMELVSKRVPLPPVPHVPLAELEGKSVFEQFLLVWGTPERGAMLWEMWQAGRDPFSQQMLEQLAHSTAEEANISLDEAKRRLAVEKVLSDVGPDYAARFLESYKNFVFTYSRPLKPMVIRPKKRR